MYGAFICPEYNYIGVQSDAIQGELGLFMDVQLIILLVAKHYKLF